MNTHIKRLCHYKVISLNKENRYRWKTGVLLVFLLVIVSCRSNREAVLSKYPLKVRLNESRWSRTGLPIESKTNYLLFNLPKKDSLILKFDGGQAFIYPMKSRTFLMKVFSQKQDKLLYIGHFFVPAVVHSDYSVVVDPEYYIDTYKSDQYLKPIMIGEGEYLGEKFLYKTRFIYSNGELLQPINLDTIDQY